MPRYEEQPWPPLDAEGGGDIGPGSERDRLLGSPAGAPKSQFWSIYDTPSLTASRFDWKSPVLTVLTVAGTSGENISLPLWIGSFGEAFSGPYFILLFASLCFTVAFGLMSLVHSVFFRCEWPRFAEYWKLYVAIGVVDAANGLLLVYASPMSRTPPLLQALLPAMGIVFGLISTRIFIDRRDSPISYLRWPAVTALLLVLFGIVFALVPLIKAVATGEDNLFGKGGAGTGIIWSVVFTSAMIPGALYQVLQEKFLKSRKRSERENSRRSRFFDITVMLLWGCLFQLLSIVGCFWVDIIPGYGFSKDIGSLWDGLGSAFGCFFGAEESPGAACGGAVSYLGTIFISGYFIAYLAGSALNESSANFNIIASTLVSPVVAVFWFIFPQLNTNKGTTPPGFIIPALIACLLGSVGWRVYENHEKRKHLPRAQAATLPLVN